MKEYELFVPGRLCIMGEHSDWAGRYRNVNEDIEKGYAIVTTIEEGIYAKVSKNDNFIVSFQNNFVGSFCCDMDEQKLTKLAQGDSFFSYVAGVAACIKNKFDVGGIEVVITKQNIPIKKGLSSSAAICVLIVRAFNKVYDLNLTIEEEMNYAYLGETMTKSKCGKLDQVCAYDTRPVLMTFDGDEIEVKPINVGENLYFVFADMMSKKDTIKILRELNKSFPFAKNEIDENVQKTLGKLNKELIEQSIKAIEEGNVRELGKLINLSQKNFDEFVSPACPDELSSPILHKTMNDEYLKSLSYGCKGVGSQGDGTIQFLAKDEESQEKIIDYLENKLKMTAYKLTLKKNKKITKAIIPLAGNGTRMFPITKVIKKAFLPIMERNILKPAIMCLLEELDDAGIEEIALVIDESDKPFYDNFFESDIPFEVKEKLSDDLKEYELKIRKISKKLRYIYQKEKLGLGHAISLCKGFSNDEPVLLALGDQIYQTSNTISCTKQLLNNYEKRRKLSLSVTPVSLEDVNKYGILCGNINGDFFIVNKMVEKPTKELASNELYTICNGEKKYYAVFGEYILTPLIFEKLEENIKNNLKEKGEFQLTTALNQVEKEEGMVAFIVDGNFIDIGNTKSYQKYTINIK